MQKIAPCLWFDNQAEQAAKFYTSIFKHSKIRHMTRYGEAGAAVSGRPKGSVMTVVFEIEGQEFVALNGGPHFKFSEAISLMVKCETQHEIDEMWEKLSQGGEERPCGWLKDQYGLSWQIVVPVLDVAGSGYQENGKSDAGVASHEKNRHQRVDPSLRAIVPARRVEDGTAEQNRMDRPSDFRPPRSPTRIQRSDEVYGRSGRDGRHGSPGTAGIADHPAWDSRARLHCALCGSSDLDRGSDSLDRLYRRRDFGAPANR